MGRKAIGKGIVTRGKVDDGRSWLVLPEKQERRAGSQLTRSKTACSFTRLLYQQEQEERETGEPSDAA
ncbi:hypothetical protein JCGZ_09095 [Jatropha curcas]|uniref:Uncharacterized protein n=1 Tax=Jatropha curcas TaxID=180498 RepID=A0A067KHQ5_JATCU|nr:hypothetical protein JCGZ_09095 [Jatropha curcas]